MIDPTKPIALSNSSAALFNECEQRAFYKYISKESVDPDYVEPNYFAFGNAFHSVLEWSKRDHNFFTMELIRSACTKYSLNFNNDGAKLAAMLRSYWPLQLNENMQVVAMELWIEHDNFKGKADAILDDGDLWWICDDKTTGLALSDTKRVELINDSQMNLYAAHHDVIAKLAGLHPERFGGILYREVEKPRQRYKDGETFEEFHARITQPKAREIKISADLLNYDSAYQNFLQITKRAREIQAEFLQGKEVSVKKNFKSCKTFNQPCPFWSKCYGSCYSRAKDSEILDIL